MDFQFNSSDLHLSTDTEGKRLAKELENLKSKSVSELKELLERQNNILSKPHLVGHLPDKGQKLQWLKERVEAELVLRASPACVDNMMNALSSVQLNGMEWNAADSSAAASAVETSSDPLYNFLQTSKNEKSSSMDPYVESLCKKSNTPQLVTEQHDRFMPFLSTDSNSPKSPQRDEIQHKTKSSNYQEHLVKPLPITESLKLLKDQAETVAKKSSNSLMNVWRQRATVSSDTEDEEEEEAIQLMDEAEKEEEEGDPPSVPDDKD